MKTYKDRTLVSTRDIGDQLAERPEGRYIFFTGFGGYVITRYRIDAQCVEGWYEGGLAVAVPLDSEWQIVDRYALDYQTGAELDALRAAEGEVAGDPVIIKGAPADNASIPVISDLEAKGYL